MVIALHSLLDCIYRIQVEDLRSKLAGHLFEQQCHYINFLTFHDGTEDRQKTEIIVNKINELKSSGIWNTDLGDCLPLAMANLLKHPIRIYSSNLSNPVTDIEPDLSEERDGSMIFYFIVSGEINVYLVKIKVVSISSEMISYHFTIVTDTIYIFTPRFGRLRFSSLFQMWILPPLQIFEHL